jgi:hypothetical protein
MTRIQSSNYTGERFKPKKVNVARRCQFLNMQFLQLTEPVKSTIEI